MKIAFSALSLALLFSFCAQATSYYSRQAGAFYTSASWSTVSHTGSAAGSPPCTCGPCPVNGSTNIYISHAVTINCDLTFSGNPTVVIESGGSLAVTGNASVSGSATFTVDAGATVNVTGNFNINGGGGAVTVNGTLNISGNLTVIGSFPFCGTGVVNLSGSLSGSGGPCNTLLFPLPVTWLSFDVKYQYHKAELRWATASEYHNDYFTIEKSADGINYAEMLRVNGSGNTTAVHEYRCLDVAPTDGINYYRIKQTDYDGHFEYYKVIALFVSDDGKSVTVYPSLVTDHEVFINFTGCAGETAKVYLSDCKGNLVQQRQYLIRNNREQVEFPLPSTLPSSAYFLSVLTGAYFNSQKIIISSY